MSTNSKFAKKDNIIKEMEACMELVHQFSQTLKQNRKKVSQMKQLKRESSIDLESKTDSEISIVKGSSGLLSLYRLNFPVSQEDAKFLLKELYIRLVAKKLALGAVIDITGQVFESQLVLLMNRKLSYDNAYHLRKTARYLFQITPFDCERTRDRIELIDCVEQKLQEYGFSVAVRQEEYIVAKTFTKQEQIQLVKSLTTQGIRYQAYPFKECCEILERAVGQLETFYIFVTYVRDKRPLTMMNPFEVLGIPGGIVPSYFKKESMITATTNESFMVMEEEYLLEDCEIECIPYETVFGGSVGSDLFKYQ